MRLKVSNVENGIRQDQRIVSISARDGDHFLNIHKTSLGDDESIEIGYPLQRRSGEYLVELPAETDDGAWRIWVDRSLIIEPSNYEAAE